MWPSAEPASTGVLSAPLHRHFLKGALYLKAPRTVAEREPLCPAAVFSSVGETGIMLSRLPDDSGYGRVFWIVAGAVIAGVVGVPLYYLVDALTPKPHFDVAVGLASDHHNLQIRLSNSSHLADSKSVVIGIHLGFGVNDNAATIQSDTRCRRFTVNSANGEMFHDVDISFQCPFINKGDSVDFWSNNIASPPAFVSVKVVSEGQSTEVTYEGVGNRTEPVTFHGLKFSPVTVPCFAALRVIYPP